MREREVFNSVVKAPLDQRAAMIDKLCGDDTQLRAQVESLLRAHDESEQSLFERKKGHADLTPGWDRGIFPGTTLGGRYKLLESIGEGGMGTVWIAEQLTPVRRKVAIKLIKPGMDSRSVLARFEAERQALSLMDHPNIARVFDGGVTDRGRPFFVMEYVKGVPLIEYCDQAQMSIGARVELFIPVCHAIQHAHQKGIIHRDLKPSNILVCLYDGIPVPKVIDFGLAKAMNQRLTDLTLYTSHGLIIGTPLYMSPEQAEFNNLDIDIRSDIYSLGVVLYELLTGVTPLEKSLFDEAALDEILRLIKEVEPPTPSTRLSGAENLPSIAAQRGLEPAKLSRLLHGDLDWIVMKALDKERCRRYETASSFARDLQRFLNEEAVEAGPPSTVYRVRKLAHKYRSPLMIAGAFVALLLAGSVVSLWQAIRATKAEEDTRTALVVVKEREREAVQASEREAAARIQVQEQLYESLVNQAEADLSSRRIGQRSNALRAIAQAKALRKTDELRELAIAALALPDIETLRTFPLPTKGSFAAFDDRLRRVAVSVDSGRRVEVWDSVANNRLRAISGKGSGQVGKLSPDGRWLILFDPPYSTVVWEVDAVGEARRRFPSLMYDQVTFDAEKNLAAVNTTHSVDIYELSHWNALHELPLANVDNVVFRPGHTELAWSQGSNVVVGRLSDGAPLASFEQTATPSSVGSHVDGLCWAPDGRRLAVAFGSTRIRLWDVEQRAILGEVQGDTSGGTVMSFSSDGDVLVSNGWADTLRFYRTNPFQALVAPLHTNHIGKSYPQSGPHRAFVGMPFDKGVLPVACLVGMRECINIEPTHAKSSVVEPAIHPSGSWWVTALRRSGILEFHDLDGRLIARQAVPTEVLAVSFDNSGALRTITPGGVYCWPLSSREQCRWTFGPPQRVADSSYLMPIESADGGRLIKVQPDRQVIALDAKSRRVIAKIGSLPLQHAVMPALSADGTYAAFCEIVRPSIVLWNLNSGVRVAEIPTSTPFRPRFSPNGQRLLLEATDQPLELLHFRTWEKVGDLGIGYSAAFSNDGSFIACDDGAGKLRLIEAESGRTLARFRHPDGNSGSPKSTPDGTHLIALRNDHNAVFIWNLRLIRNQLAELDLDWDSPPFQPESESKNDPIPQGAIRLVGIERIEPWHAPELASRLRKVWEAQERSDTDGAQAELTQLCDTYHDNGSVMAVVQALKALSSDSVDDIVGAAVARDAIRQLPFSSELLLTPAWRFLMTPAEKPLYGLGLQLAREAMVLAPNDGEAQVAVGIGLYRTGRFSESISALEAGSAAAWESRGGYALYILAMARKRLGETVMARECYERALRWSEKGSMTATAFRELQLLRAEAESLLFGSLAK